MLRELHDRSKLRHSKNLLSLVLQQSWSRSQQNHSGRTRLPAAEQDAECPDNGDDGLRLPEDEPGPSRALTTLTALALGNATEGRSGRAFERDVMRYHLAGADVGASQHSRKFFEEAVFTGALVSRMMDAMDWNRQLPGTGIVSDLSLKLVGLIGSMTCSRGV